MELPAILASNLYLSDCETSVVNSIILSTPVTIIGLVYVFSFLGGKSYSFPNFVSESAGELRLISCLGLISN